jgi:hypothetical protein
MVFLLRFSLLLFLFTMIGRAAAGQSSPTDRINGSFTGQTFHQFVQQVEAQTAYRFYYLPSQFDSLSVTLEVREQPLPAVLSQLFRGTAYHYAIDTEKRVFATKGVKLQDELPFGFFTRENDGKEDEGTIPDFLAGRETSLRKIDAETKLHEIGIKTATIRPGTATLAGTIVDMKTGEPVIGAVVLVQDPWTAAATNQFGYYSITLPRGRHEVQLKSVGMKNTKRQIMLYSDGKLNLELQEDVVALKEVNIEAGRDANVSGMQMGVEKLDIRTLKQVPTAFGEADILKVVLTLPGVKSVGESSTGLNVRGGAVDQNLILFNDATVYNPSHLFGFFSAFNPDVLKTVELFKNSIPAKYGGRLASVLEVTSREGNKRQFSGSGGIGLITGRLTLEGPIIKDRTSFLIGGRSTYSDWLLRRLPSPTLRNSTASFYDVNASISHDVNEKNTLQLSAYLSQDAFKLGLDTLFQYRNQNVSLKWNHIFQNNFYSTFTAGVSDYAYSVTSDKIPVNAYEMTYRLSQSNAKIDFSYFPIAKHSIEFGASAIHYRMQPGNFRPLGGESLIRPDVLQQEQALESALYISDKYDVSPRLSLYAGLRYSFYHYLGPKDVIQYASGIPKTENTMTDTVSFGAGRTINTYHGPEYRLALRYTLSDNSSLKLSYNRMRQYLHMLSNTAMMSPTDIWKLSDPHIRPQVGDQYSLGIFKNLKNNMIETSVEAYYKTMQDFLDFRSGAALILNHHIETDVISAEGTAYGVETMIKKANGKLNGWVSYTYSRSLLRTNDLVTAEVINRGAYYPSNFDKPHDFTLVSNYRFSRRFSTSFNFTYSTGRPITLPLAVYELGGAKRLYYSDRNQFRIPDYYRADLAMNIEGNHKIQKLAHSSWTLSVYNLTGRRNPYSIFFRSQNGVVKGYQLSVFGQPIPTVTYNFKF